MPPVSPRDASSSPPSVSPSSGGNMPKRPSLQRRDSFVRSPRFSSRRLTGAGMAGRSPSLLTMDHALGGGGGDETSSQQGLSPAGSSPNLSLSVAGASAAKAARRASSMFTANARLGGMGSSGTLLARDPSVARVPGGPARDYRETYQHMLNKVGSDTKDLEWDLLEHKTRMIEPIPKERKVSHSFMIYEHLRPIPRSVCDEPEGASLDIVHGPPKVWKVGHPMTPTVKVQLISLEDQPIAAWKANIEVKAVLLNGTGDWLLERGDGRSIILGNVSFLDGWEAEFPELRMMDTSEHYKRAQFRLLFVVNNYRVAPVMSEPFTIEQEACPKSENYLYEAEEEEEVDFAVPADKNPDANMGIEASPLHVAASMGQAELCKLLVAKGDDLNQLAQHGISPLHLLAYLGNTSLARTFVECGAEVNTAADSGMTAIHFALMGGQYATARALLEVEELDPRAITTRGWGCMHIAARAAPPDIIRALARAGGDVDLRNRDGQTPLHIAAFHGNMPVMRELVRSGADPTCKAKGGWTLAHQAVIGGSTRVLQLLQELSSPLDESLDGCLFTPLHIACLKAVPETVRTLLDAGASPHALSSTGWSAAHFAACSGDQETLDMVLEAGAPVVPGDQPTGVSGGTNSYNGSTSALRVAIEYGQEHLAETLLPRVPESERAEVMGSIGASGVRRTVAGHGGPVTPGDPHSAARGERVVVKREPETWKRGDKASWDTFVAILREGSLPDKKEVLLSLVEDGQDNVYDARNLLEYGCDQPLRDIIRRNCVAPTVIDKSLSLLTRLAKYEKEEGSVITDKCIPDLLNLCEIGARAAAIVESRLGDDRAKAQFVAAAGPEKIARLRGGFASMSEEELVSLAKAAAAKGSGGGSGGGGGGGGGGSGQRGHVVGSKSTMSDPTLPSGTGPVPPIKPSSSRKSPVRIISSEPPSPSITVASPQPKHVTNAAGGETAVNGNSNSNATPNATTGAASISSSTPAVMTSAPDTTAAAAAPVKAPGAGKAQKVVDLVGTTLPENSKVGILILGRSRSGRKAILEEAAGAGLPGRAFSRVTTAEGTFGACNASLPGGRQVALFTHAGLDPGSDASSEAWRASLQFVVDANSQARGAPAPPICCVWYCVDPLATALTPQEALWISALAECLPVVIVVTAGPDTLAALQAGTQPASGSRAAAAECVSLLETHEPPLAFYGDVVRIDAGLGVLARETARAVAEGTGMMEEMGAVRAAVSGGRAMTEAQRKDRLASAAAFIAPALEMVPSLVGQSVPLAHVGPTLELAGMAALSGVSYVLGVPFNKDGVAEVWALVFGTEGKPNKTLLRKLIAGIAGSGGGGGGGGNGDAGAGAVTDVATCVSLITALAVSYAEVLIELGLDGTLAAATPAMLARTVIPELEAMCDKGKQAIEAALRRALS